MHTGFRPSPSFLSPTRYTSYCLIFLGVFFLCCRDTRLSYHLLPCNRITRDPMTLPPIGQIQRLMADHDYLTWLSGYHFACYGVWWRNDQNLMRASMFFWQYHPVQYSRGSSRAQSKHLSPFDRDWFAHERMVPKPARFAGHMQDSLSRPMTFRGPLSYHITKVYQNLVAATPMSMMCACVRLVGPALVIVNSPTI
ncbi:hypothetical protein PISMIDRAFT_529818 [Pisolithus microcarpus 441]|uniref:Uncharacterized protein n=1 Tax=Pisolithus microcarpus 441 TaxID=765257 RepID=A0A0C9YZ75_9AGAM|nr:hypothetical protein PISMIDRAFT_529818 [Pisolithus microcarpus 441]